MSSDSEGLFSFKFDFDFDLNDLDPFQVRRIILYSRVPFQILIQSDLIFDHLHDMRKAQKTIEK